MKKELIAIIVVAVLIFAFAVYYKPKDCVSDLNTSACDSLLGAELLKCYKNLSYYKNDFCICANLEEPNEQDCYIEFIWKTKNEEICELDSLKSFESGQGYSGTDICYYKLVTENANVFSKRWYEKDIVRLCQKIKNTELKDKCFLAKKFAINESVKGN